MDIKLECFVLFFIYVWFCLLQQLGVEYVVIEWWVVFGVVQCFVWMWFCGFQQFIQIQFLLFGGEFIQFFEQIGVVNQIYQMFDVQLGYQFVGFMGDKFKVVGYFEWQIVIVIFMQFVILGCYVGSVVVQVVNMQVFIVQCDYWVGIEIEVFCVEDCCFDDIEVGFQVVIYLQMDFMMQIVGNQCLLGFYQVEFLWVVGIFY